MSLDNNHSTKALVSFRMGSGIASVCVHMHLQACVHTHAHTYSHNHTELVLVKVMFGPSYISVPMTTVNQGWLAFVLRGSELKSPIKQSKSHELDHL